MFGILFRMKTIKIYFVVLLIAVKPTFGLAQSLVTDDYGKYCEKERNSSIYYSDTTRRQAIIDSLNDLLIGDWQLVSISPAHYKSNLSRLSSNEKMIVMSIKEKGSATIRTELEEIIKFNISVGLSYYNTRCVIDEDGRQYFDLITPAKRKNFGTMKQGEIVYRNGLGICKEGLVINAFTSTGPKYVFKRIILQSKMEK